MTSLLILGTRGSPLALKQAHLVAEALRHHSPHLQIVIETFQTTGDRIQDRTLNTLGGKGLFTKEIEEALLQKTIHVAVHSMKDVATTLPDGLMIPVTLMREDVRDALISPAYKSFQDLPEKALFGTASLRRKAQVLRVRPDLQVIPLRGNVQTRLEKIRTGVASGTLLALAGLKRVQLENEATMILSIKDFLPAIAQGAIGLQCRADDQETRALLAPLQHLHTFDAITLERAFLKAVDGSCMTPIAGLAQRHGNLWRFDGMVFTEDGQEAAQETIEGPYDFVYAEVERLGHFMKAWLQGHQK